MPVRKRRAQPLLVLALGLPACASIAVQEEVAEAPVKPATNAAKLQKATILDTDFYQPRARLEGCDGGALSRASEISAELAAGLKEAKAYSDNAKGVGLIVLRDGEIVHESYNTNADAQTHTVSASMMKSVLGLMTGIAIDKGMIGSVDDPIGKYLAEWENDPRGDVTVRQLLTMSSGLGRSDFMKLLLSRDIGAAALETPIATEPGSTFAYNNAVSQLLGMIVDRRARKKDYDGFRDFLQREFWCPLGNSNARLWIDGKGNPRYYAGLQAGLRDWARVGELIRNKGRANGEQIVPAAWIEEMAQPSRANPQYGYQIWLGGSWTAKGVTAMQIPSPCRIQSPISQGMSFSSTGLEGSVFILCHQKALRSRARDSRTSVMTMPSS